MTFSEVSGLIDEKRGVGIGQRVAHWGEVLAWLTFLATTLHLAFLIPSGNLFMPWERAKVFSGGMCCLSLLLAILFGKKPATLHARSPEVWISAVLLLLLLLSACFSADPGASFPRAFVAGSSACGGFWCARLLLHNRKKVRLFLRLCLFLFAGILLAGIAGMAAYGNVVHFIDTNWHPVGGRIFLLSFAPIALCASNAVGRRVLGIFLLLCGCVVLLLSGRAAGAGANVLIPAVLCGLALLLGRWRVKHAMVLILLLLLLGGGIARHFRVHCWDIDKSHQSIAYRVESLFFSWHIARQHWLLGNGPWAPREAYLEEYRLSYPYLSEETFAAWVRYLRVSENAFLTLMADLGLPFFLIYTGVLLYYLNRMLRLHRKGQAGLQIPALALLLPVTGEVLHLLVYDGFFHPQSSWYLHILLGLIPPAAHGKGSGTQPCG
jgi:hypothetical protein